MNGMVAFRHFVTLGCLQDLLGCEVFVPAAPSLPNAGEKVELVKQWTDSDTVVLAFGRSFG